MFKIRPHVEMPFITGPTPTLFDRCLDRQSINFDHTQKLVSKYIYLWSAFVDRSIPVEQIFVLNVVFLPRESYPPARAQQTTTVVSSRAISFNFFKLTFSYLYPNATSSFECIERKQIETLPGDGTQIQAGRLLRD